jgi:hypothetical protein
MEKQFELHKVTRKNILDFASAFSIEELNEIPIQFNNNIIWNIGHLLATQQILIYKFSDTDFTIYTDFIERYRKGTKPEKFIGAEEWKFIQSHLIQTADEMQKNYREKYFHKYQKYETSYGAMLDSIEDAICFINIHESMHFGYIKAIGKVLKNNQPR